MQEVSLGDANVVLRYLTEDIKHPKYAICCRLLQQPLLVRYYVLPEIVFQFLAYYRKDMAKNEAINNGSYAAFCEDTKLYIRTHKPPAHWRIKAYEMFEIALNDLLNTFPTVQVANHDLFAKALEIAKQTGFDWVDCTLLAEHQLYGRTIASVDKDIEKGLKLLQKNSVAASSGVKPLSFT